MEKETSYKDFELVRAIQIKSPGEYLWGFPIWGYESVIENGEIRIILNGRLVDQNGDALKTYVDEEHNNRYVSVNDQIVYLHDIRLSNGMEWEYLLLLEGAIEPTDYRQYLAAGQWAIDTGWAWKAQGVYGRMCMALIEDGYCTKRYQELDTNKQQDTE